MTSLKEGVKRAFYRVSRHNEVKCILSIGFRQWVIPCEKISQNIDPSE